MAVFSVDLMVGRSSEITEKFETLYVRKYQVISDNMTDDEYTVRTNLGFALFNPHPSDSGSRIRHIAVEEQERLTDARNDGTMHAGTRWIATLTYTDINPLDVTTTGDPVNTPLEVSIDGEVYSKIIDEDQSGDPIVNDAGDSFDPPVEVDQLRCSIKIAQNVTDLKIGGLHPIATLLGYANSVNSDIWFGFPVRTVKFQPPRITPFYSSFANVVFFRVEYEFVYNPDTWDKKILNAGYRQLVTVSGTTTQETILVAGQPATAPCLLDTSGHYIPPPVNASDAVYLTFEVYPAINFTTTFAFPSTIFGV